MKMKKIFGLILLMLLTAGMMVGCGGAADEGKEKEKEQTNHAQHEAFPITIKDASGEKVTIEKEPKKIVSLIPSNTEVVFALGLGKKVVGVSDNDNGADCLHEA
jgi:iron complex transport system substrate-binding protein